jgi:prokaryotic ubiquitin-like protein Pup
MAPGGEQTRKGKPRREEEAAPDEQKSTEAQGEDVDELLDEIDEVLESNAEEFVRSFIQKGGE